MAKKSHELEEGALDGQVPFGGAALVVATRDGVDVIRTVDRVWRRTDDANVFTVRDSDGYTRWIRWDLVRGSFVRSDSNADGEPVPEPSIPITEPVAEPVAEP